MSVRDDPDDLIIVPMPETGEVLAGIRRDPRRVPNLESGELLPKVVWRALVARDLNCAPFVDAAYGLPAAHALTAWLESENATLRGVALRVFRTCKQAVLVDAVRGVAHSLSDSTRYDLQSVVRFSSGTSDTTRQAWHQPSARAAGVTGVVRPFLLIDIDGVLNPLAVQPSGRVPPGFAAHDLEGLRVLLDGRHGAWLSELAVDFDLVWATSWEHDADRLIAERVGLPRGLPVITFDSPQTGWTTKLPDVIRFVGDRPVAWVDDVFGPEEHGWASTRDVPTLLIHTDHRVGLTAAHIDRLRRFALDLRL